MTEKKENFIAVFNRSFELTDGKLSVDDLYIYSYIYRLRIPYNEQWITETSVMMICSKIGNYISGKGNKKLNTLKYSLLKLKSLNYITCGITDTTKKNDLLSITFPSVSDGNFTRITYDLFDSFKDKESYYLFTYIKSIGPWGKKLSFLDIAELLDVSESTAKKRVLAMNTSNSNPGIYKFSGSYSGNGVKQDVNHYYVDPEQSIIDRWNRLYDENGKVRVFKHKKYKAMDETVYSINFGDMTVEKFIEACNESNWGVKDNTPWATKTKVDLEYGDYELYRICIDERINHPEFILKCKNSIARALEINHYRFKEWEDTYQRDRQLLQEGYLDV